MAAKFYRARRQPTADPAFTAGLADCAFVAAHASACQRLGDAPTIRVNVSEKC